MIRPRSALPSATLGLACAILASYVYFPPRPAWNQCSRFVLTRALVRQHSVRIDDEHWITGDKAFRDGHFYSDKAPGTSWLAMIPCALLELGRTPWRDDTPELGVLADGAPPHELAPLRDPLPGEHLHFGSAFLRALYVCTIVAVGLPSLAGAFALRRLVRSKASTAIADKTTWIYALATPAFVYSTALYGHQLCAAALVIGLALAAAPLAARDHGQAAPRRSALASPWLCGSALGFAVCTEYTAAGAALLVGAFAAWRGGAAAAVRVALGAAPFALLLAAYHQAAFGGPLQTGYDFVAHPVFAEGMRARYGLGVPSLGVLHELTFGPYRGLFHLSPVLLLAVWGLASDCLARDRLAWLAAAIVLYFAALNAAYFMWDGGSAMGPRHLVPALPFLALGLRRPLSILPVATGCLATVSALQMLLAAAAGPEAPPHGDALWDFAIARVLEDGPPMLGHHLGLPGVAGLLPLLGIWAYSVLGLRRSSAQEPLRIGRAPKPWPDHPRA